MFKTRLRFLLLFAQVEYNHLTPHGNENQVLFCETSYFFQILYSLQEILKTQSNFLIIYFLLANRAFTGLPSLLLLN